MLNLFFNYNFYFVKLTFNWNLYVFKKPFLQSQQKRASQEWPIPSSSILFAKFLSRAALSRRKSPHLRHRRCDRCCQKCRISLSRLRPAFHRESEKKNKTKKIKDRHLNIASTGDMRDIVKCPTSRFDSAPVGSSRLDLHISAFWRVSRIRQTSAFRLDICQIQLLRRDFYISTS